MPKCFRCKKIVPAVHPESKLCQECIVDEQIRAMEDNNQNNRRSNWEKKKRKR